MVAGRRAHHRPFHLCYCFSYGWPPFRRGRNGSAISSMGCYLRWTVVYKSLSCPSIFGYTSSPLFLHPSLNFCRLQLLFPGLPYFHFASRLSIYQTRSLLVAGRPYPFIPFEQDYIHISKQDINTAKMQFFALITLALSAVASAELSKHYHTLTQE